MKVLIVLSLVIATTVSFACDELVTPTQAHWNGIQQIVKGVKSPIHITAKELTKLRKLTKDGYVLRPLSLTKIGEMDTYRDYIWFSKGTKNLGTARLIAVLRDKQGRHWIQVNPPAG